jgi:hypothetical protein
MGRSIRRGGRSLRRKHGARSYGSEARGSARVEFDGVSSSGDEESWSIGCTIDGR